jgi:hypothetical protein
VQKIVSKAGSPNLKFSLTSREQLELVLDVAERFLQVTILILLTFSVPFRGTPRMPQTFF